MIAIAHLPEKIRLDAPLWGRVTGLSAGAEADVQATLRDHLGQAWSSQAAYEADGAGEIDLAAAPPVTGGWRGPDAYGLYWSMRRNPADACPGIGSDSIDVALSGLSSLTVELSVTSGLQQRSASVEREVVSRATAVEWRDDLTANLFLPHRPRSRAAALVLGGSGGGFSWSNPVAAMLAASGVAALAMAYFDWNGSDGLPSSITELPLERFGAALDRLAHDSPAAVGPLVVVGFSKGAEAALALAARRADIDTVIAVSPSAYTWEAARAQPMDVPRSSWTWDGAPLPFLRLDADAEFYASFDKTRLRHFHERAIAEQDLEPARIRVEDTTAEMLLISGTADSTWPAMTMAEKIVSARATAAGRATRHLPFEGAGHLLLPPGLPSHRWDGEPSANAAADRGAWAAIRRLLQLS